ncbi:hypothetical protein BTA51_14745 [Hahella sp. CCB-MM4]|uniref:YopT-type cysteine protease domain-containing protein n=1 Tax=Hahella sp. (strain CCB-MM4) TaxID=1926491 RepID=UPI000B9A91F7|nr:YopT-type cysteine protease domain-containing protein [Hahella sp. CCB-MM4]OZG72776.1 hypothetical protein BTA51_14745 [Hahella sp. CCB-MM4]
MPNRAYPLDRVQQLVSDYNGLCTWDFSQGYPLHFIQGPVGNGICMGLSCHWVQYHALDDSLVNHLGAVWNPNTRIYKPFNHHELQRISAWQRSLTRFPDWVMGYQAWLRNNGLGIHSNNRIPMNSNALKAELDRIKGGYALIILSGQNTRDSHAIAAYIGQDGEDVCFFDPNYGEFWFQDRDDFFFFLHLFSNFVYNRNHRHNTGFNRYEVVRIYRQ